MADAATPNHPQSTSSGQPSSEVQPAASSSGRLGRRAILVLALAGIAFAGWSLMYKPSGWLPRLYAPEFAVLEPPPQPQDFYKLTNATVPKERFVFSGTALDGIPALNSPKFIASNEATFLSTKDRVIGVSIGGESKAYPIEILNYHQAVNDRVGDVPVLVTYCPWSDAAVVFERTVQNQELEFGVSDMLFNSNALLYSRTDDTVKSLWSQLSSQAVTGRYAGTKLVSRPLELTTWSDWSTRHTSTKVLSSETGYPINYTHDPYRRYARVAHVHFPVEPLNTELPKKTHVLGVWTAGAARAYPISAFKSVQQPSDLEQTLDGINFTLRYDPSVPSLRITRSDGLLETAYAYWFAWHAFHPDGELYEPVAK